MRIVVQRVQSASVRVGGAEIAAIGPGMLLLVGLLKGDTLETLQQFATKLLKLRIFEDEGGKMNLSLGQTGGAILAVSQFTLGASLKGGNRPGFEFAMPPEEAANRFEEFCALLRAGGADVQTGRFGAHMEVSLVNDGPATFVLE